MSEAENKSGLPFSEEAEQSVIGAILLDTAFAYPQVSAYLRAEDFYIERYRELYKGIEGVIKEKQDFSVVDSVTLGDYMEKNNKIKRIGGRSFISQLVNSIPTARNADAYGQIVKEYSELRSLIKITADFNARAKDAKEGAHELINEAERQILEISTGRQNRDYYHLSQIISENIEELQRRRDIIDEYKKKNIEYKDVIGLMTNYTSIDNHLGGLQPGTLNIIAARPGMGKTALALSIATNVAIDQEKTVLVFSLEMSKEELGMRILSSRSKVDSSILKNPGEIDDESWRKVYETKKSIDKGNMIIDEGSNISIMEIRNKCRRIKAETGQLDLVVVDYLQLMGGAGENRQTVVSDLSRNLKLLAKEMSCPFIVLSQLSRSPEQRNDKHPMLSDLRESGSIEQDADTVIFLYRQEYYEDVDDSKKGMTEVIFAKNRSGPTGTVFLNWISRYTTFANLASHNDQIMSNQLKEEMVKRAVQESKNDMPF